MDRLIAVLVGFIGAVLCAWSWLAQYALVFAK